MSSKTIIQFILIALALTLSTIFYYQYFHKEKSNEKISKEEKKLENESEMDNGNIIKDIVYKSKDKNGNLYIIKSEFGEVDSTNQDIIFMTKVTAIMKLSDGTTINLTSLNANYNSFNNDTNFFNKVYLNYLDHNVKANNIDIFFKDSKIEAYNNLVYKNLDLNLIADKVEIDLITKNSKIYMLNEKKVKIIKNK